MGEQMRQATLKVVFGPGRVVVADEWQVTLNGVAQFAQIKIDGQPIKVRHEKETFGQHPNGGSMIPLRSGQEMEVSTAFMYPGKGRVQIVLMTHASGRQVRVKDNNTYMLV